MALTYRARADVSSHHFAALGITEADDCFHEGLQRRRGSHLSLANSVVLNREVRVGNHKFPNLAIELVARGNELAQCAAGRREGVEFFG